MEQGIVATVRESIRLSPHAYNTREEVREAVARIASL
jgi:selenocysteine lyase/cysteine desulfurase